MKKTQVILDFVSHAMVWGIGSGALFGFGIIMAFSLSDPSLNALIYGVIMGIPAAIVGVFCGLMIGTIGGFVLAIVTILFKNPQHNENPYRTTMILTGIVITFSISAGILYNLLKFYSVTDEISVSFLLFLAIIASMFGAFATQRGTNWYLQTLKSKKH